MKVEIAFKSKKNTKKIAEVMGEALHIKPIKIDGSKKIDEADILFLGFGIYAGDVPKEVKDFIKTLNPTKIKKVVLFMTCGSGIDQSEKLKEEIRKKGLNLEEKTFCCKGKMFLFSIKNLPDDKDFQQARSFAMSFI
ncbi:MAG: flavodoxin family protein [Lachnospiraceae bacterium]|nr:flavodoxin family protein [Lachnospiraceae bacterium]